ncbi:CYFA0S08e05160g1_1 [Cyberlindnera fabianii]|uniref:CYFA0S08e05160g1_1 n=1 Tax=Cyberlindnera fabianii TaxID=36022 RepID=A0A061AXF1_CYBFA|nr:CYFA0S08e05160g1_1 [Cyberlindnera fabianii]
MAKSLRSKSKLKAKSVKRGKEFQAAVDERTKRLHEKAKLDLIKQKQAAGEEVSEDVVAEDAMVDDEEAENKKKVSTSGTRGSRHQKIKMKKGKKNMHTNFRTKKK